MRLTSIETIRTKIALPESTCVICFFATNTSRHAAHSSAGKTNSILVNVHLLVIKACFHICNVPRRALLLQDYDYDYDLFG